MAKVRIGFSTHFEVENELVGIGTDNPTNTKQVLGNIHATNAKAVGIATLTTPFDGFTDTKLSLQGSAGAKQGTTSGEIIIEGDVTVSSGTTYTSGPENLTVTDNFTLPGISDDRPTAGTTRFNENLGSLEFYTGVEWKAVNSFVDMSNRGRAVWMGGNETNAAGGQNDHCPTTDYVQIQTLGNAIDFGTLNQSTAQNSSYGSSIEAFSNGFGQSSTQQNYIQNAKFASGGNFEDFGDLTRVVRMSASVNSSTRGVTAGGAGGVNVMDYLELQTKGNALDFGDLHSGRRGNNSSFSSSTRGVFAGGTESDTAKINYITIASKGNASDFGNVCTFAGGYKGSSSSTTRGIQGGGSGYRNIIEFHEIASNGNAVYFGDLNEEGRTGANGASTQTRAVFGGGGVSPDAANRRNWIEYVTISSSGNAADFGDLTSKRCIGACTSDSHGGLGGF